MGVGQLEDIHFDQFSAIFAIFRPLWNHTEGPEEPNYSVTVPLNSQEEHVELHRSEKEGINTEIWLCWWVPLFWACQLHDFWSSGRTLHSYLQTVISVCEKNLLSILDTPVFTDCENMNWSSREQPPKMVTVHENHSHPCNIDDPE